MSNISVLMPTYNRANYIRESIHSVLNQTVPPKQVLIIDDGSTDNTAEVVAEFGDRVTYLKKENGGKSSALNFGLPYVTGDYIWIFDDDDIALPEANEVRLNIFQENPDCGLVFGATRHFKACDSGVAEPYWSASLDIPDGREGFYALLIENTFFLSSALLSKKCVSDVGLFNTELIRAQDYEYLIRVARFFEIRNCGSYIFLFRDHPGVRGSSRLKFDIQERQNYAVSFERKIGSWIRSTLAMNEYDAGPESCARNAVVHRAAVMGSKGLHAQMLEDLNAALQLDQARPLTDMEAGYIQSVWSAPGFWSQDMHNFYKELLAIRQSVFAASVLRAFSRIYYWSFRSRLEFLPPRRQLLLLTIRSTISSWRFFAYENLK